MRTYSPPVLAGGVVLCWTTEKRLLWAKGTGSKADGGIDNPSTHAGNLPYTRETLMWRIRKTTLDKLRTVAFDGFESTLFIKQK